MNPKKTKTRKADELAKLNKVRPLAVYLLQNGPVLTRWRCRQVIGRIAVDPVLPEAFEQTDNEKRSSRELAWWGVPFVRQRGEAWEVRCLDGGAWDRSTWRGTARTLEYAVELAERILVDSRRFWDVCSRGGPVVRASQAGLLERVEGGAA